MTTFQPRHVNLAPRLGEDQEEKEEDSPSFGRCRPLSRVADSGPKAKVNYPYISAFPSLMIYPRMCGHVLEPDSRPGLRPVNASGASANVPTGTLPASGLSRGWPNKGPADGYPKPKPQEWPHPGLAEGPEQLKKLPQKPPSPRERPHPRSAEGLTTTPATPTGEPREQPKPGPAEGPGQPRKLQQGPPVACQGDSEPSLGSNHWGPITVQAWSNHARATGSLPLVATKKKKKHIELSWFLF